MLLLLPVAALSQTALLDSLHRAQDTASSPRSRMGLALEQANAWMRVNADSAHQICSRVLRQAGAYPTLAANAADQLSMYWMQQGNSDSAAWYLERSRQICQAAGHAKGLIQYYNSKGRLAASQQDFALAEQCYQTGLHLADSIHSEPPLYQFYTNLGVLYARQNRSQEAIDYFRKALPYYEKTDNQVVRGMLYGNIGLAFATIDVPDSSIGYMLKSIQIKRLQGDIKGMASAYSSLTQIYTERENWPKAIESCRKSITFYTEAKNPTQTAQQFGHLSALYVLSNQPAEALAAADSGLAVATPDMVLQRLYLHEEMAKACDMQHNQAQALAHWQEVALLAEKLNLADIRDNALGHIGKQ